MDVAALHYTGHQAGLSTLNLGIGQGASVVDAFERVSGQHVTREMAPRRAGNVPSCWADASLARATLDWHARRGLNQMCFDSWHWQQNNPNGQGS